MKYHNGRPYCENREDEATLYADLDSAKRDAAIACLRIELVGVSVEIREAIDKNPEGWCAHYHFGWGMEVRNRLRRAGFGEDAFNIANLDDIYVPLIEAAVEVER